MTQFDPKLLERGLVCKPGSLSTTNRIIVAARKIPYFKGSINSKKGKFHVTVGHETTMGTCTFFESQNAEHGFGNEVVHSDGEFEWFDFSKEYIYEDDLPGENNENGKVQNEGQFVDFI